MRAVRCFLLCAVVSVGVAAAPARAEEESRGSVDALARFIAGLEGGEELAGSSQRRTWGEYRRAIDARWKKLDARQLQPMRSWTASELAPLSDARRQVLYPFSGPDLIHMTTVLPDRTGYVMLSLEPVGILPDFAAFDQETFEGFFVGMRESLSSVLNWHFFQTKELREDLTVPGLEGVLPLLLFFAARDGQQVLDVRYLFVQPDGVVSETAAAPGLPATGEGVPGVRLVLRRPGAAAASHLDYFSVDLSSHSLDQRRAFFAYVAGRGPFTSYLKAASYLMFKPKYAGIGRFILDHSQQVLQDDSGIPLADFVSRGWTLKLYGSYVRPIRLFDHRYQEDLAAAYGVQGDVSPLPFAAGYKIKAADSTLMLATRGDP